MACTKSTRDTRGARLQTPLTKQSHPGATLHREAVEVHYDPKKISYAKLLDVYWRTFDPTDNGGQFADRGRQYKPGIYYASAEEKKLAEASKVSLGKLKIFSKPINTEILPASKFYRAEEYHQDYYRKNPSHYKSYRVGSGREGFLKRHWKGKENIRIIGDK